jgi:small subunit ribosomal protein S21
MAMPISLSLQMWDDFSRMRGLPARGENVICAPHGHGTPARSGANVVYAIRRCARVQVVVRDNNVDQALKALKKKLQREGVFREMKLRRHYEKPSERRAREAAEAVRRARKVERKRIEREGF